MRKQKNTFNMDPYRSSEIHSTSCKLSLEGKLTKPWMVSAGSLYGGMDCIQCDTIKGNEAHVNVYHLIIIPPSGKNHRPVL